MSYIHAQKILMTAFIDTDDIVDVSIKDIA